MSIWASMLTFDEHSEDGPPPMAYLSSSHLPRLTDPRIGQFDLATVPAMVNTATNDIIEIPAVRIGVSDAQGNHATIVLDGFQAVRLSAVLRDWVAMEGESMTNGTPS